MSSGRRERRTLGGWLVQATAWFVMLAMLAVLAVSVVIPRVAGATPYTILTGSMTPGMPPGTLVLVKPVDVDDISTGEVITYQLRSGEPTVVTHRVVGQGVMRDGTPIFRTQGDANASADKAWVRPVQIKGERWFAVPHLGRITQALTTHQRRVATLAVVIGLFGYAAAMFAGTARDRRRRRTHRGVAA